MTTQITIKITVLLSILFFMAACTNQPTPKSRKVETEQQKIGDSPRNPNHVNFAGTYLTGNKENGGDWTEIKIESLKGGERFQVTVDAKVRKGVKSCSFDKIGTVRNDTLFIETTDWKRPVTTFIVKRDNKIVFDVIEKEEDDRYVLNWYCSGGGSLIGEYVQTY